MNIKSKCIYFLFLSLLVLSYNLCTNNSQIPNDEFFKYQISFFNDGSKVTVPRVSYKKSPIELNPVEGIHLNILPAWEITTGSADTIVAVMDDGFFYSHEDIKQNLWKNAGETGLDSDGNLKETNGLDDDQNGYVDDVMGYDFYFNDPDPDCYIFEGKLDSVIAPYWHSIPALGIIGARGNNEIGVAGINWEVSMMLLKMMAQGSVSIKDPCSRVPKAAEAIRYAVDNSARVINWSGFVSCLDQEKLKPLQDAIDYAEEKGVLIVTGAGNNKENIDLEENYTFPSCFQNENLLVVAEIDFDGYLYEVERDSKYVGGSNFGVQNVDIAALSQNFTTGLRHNHSVYRLSGGTSNSAPVVSGVAALIFSIRPDLDGLEVKEILMRSATRLQGLQGKVKSGGMVNAFDALKLAQSYPQNQ
ncbi:MAG: S8 family serine peptidase [Candidatus Aminicenantes bacterium]|nr:S8 family serine peptidase [Candidatus Aminicenantes bacterium]